MEENFIPLSPDDKFRFSCTSRLSCFNECCRDLNQYLTPYDVLRLKKSLGISSGMFLKTYTSYHTGPETGLPVITLKTESASGSICPFVTPSGCKVYIDRPSSCRTYPLARLVSRNRESGRLSEYYMMINETHCLGFNDGKEQTVREWIIKEDIEPYNRMNDMLMEILSLKNQIIPGELDLKSGYLFRTALYDLDAFRSHLFSNKIEPDDFNEEDINAAKQDDTALLKIAFSWVKQNLFLQPPPITSDQGAFYFMKTANKVALVLGSITGIGKGIGLALSKKGINVVLNYFDREEMLDELKNDFSEFGSRYLITRIDLLKTYEIQGLVDNVIKHFGRLDILINNIERGGWPVVHGPYTCDQWDLEIATTLRAKQWVFECSLPYLKTSGDGTVINISSIAGMVGRSGPVSYIFNEGYSAANRGISLLTETWARIGAPEVRVNEIMTGIIETRHGEKTRGWGLLTDVQKEAIIDHTLVKRTGTIDDVVKAVCFLIKDAPFMTGSVLRIDGGYVLGGEKVFPMPEGVL